MKAERRLRQLLVVILTKSVHCYVQNVMKAERRLRLSTQLLSLSNPHYVQNVMKAERRLRLLHYLPHFVGGIWYKTS